MCPISATDHHLRIKNFSFFVMSVHAISVVAIPHSVLPLWSRLAHSAYAAHWTSCIIRMQHVDFYAIYICSTTRGTLLVKWRVTSLIPFLESLPRWPVAAAAAAAPELSQKTLANCFCIERAIRCSIRIGCSSASARILHRRAATPAIGSLCATVFAYFAYNLFRMRARPFIMYDIMFRRLSQAAGPLIKLRIALIAAHQALVKLLPRMLRCGGPRGRDRGIPRRASPQRQEQSRSRDALNSLAADSTASNLHVRVRPLGSRHAARTARTYINTCSLSRVSCASHKPSPSNPPPHAARLFAVGSRERSYLHLCKRTIRRRIGSSLMRLTPLASQLSYISVHVYIYRFGRSTGSYRRARVASIYLHVPQLGNLLTVSPTKLYNVAAASSAQHCAPAISAIWLLVVIASSAKTWTLFPSMLTFFSRQ
ncbi:unnamed protein product [Trichogramma brassicae]|uniref:Uncharacterized protein n=1 Tax=Trichogramma brassicae TaxID=86971 RepID=A0A6H5IJN1_9HYME|nr:unnamed protein product [Trichogramma brassicae]